MKYINVAMLTILKNVANVLTASGETYFFKKQHGVQVWIALMLMVCHIENLEKLEDLLLEKLIFFTSNFPPNNFYTCYLLIV